MKSSKEWLTKRLNEVEEKRTGLKGKAEEMSLPNKMLNNKGPKHLGNLKHNENIKHKNYRYERRTNPGERQ